jgi:CubicO group peptidase (beta-lactamase class C family)
MEDQMQRRDFIRTAAAAALSVAASHSRARQASAPAFKEDALAGIRNSIAGSIERKELPGAVWLLARGDQVHVDFLGDKAFEGGTPMARDTIFRLASVTKPVTAAAVMMLVEDGVIALDDPVDRLLPELANRRVLTSIDAPLDSTVPADHPFTVRELMNFTFGFGINFDPNLPIEQEITRLNLVNMTMVPQTPHNPDEWIKAFSTLPLMHQPGANWMYNTGSIIQGILINRATGRTLEDFFKERIFDPLGMKDTSFFVPPEKLDRFVAAYQFDFATNEGFLEDAPEGQWAAPPNLEHGGGGLVSTVDDFLVFARMMMNKGEHNGARLLSEHSVMEMTRDQLTSAQKAGGGLGLGFFDAMSWGYGMAVFTAPTPIAPNPGKYGWDGGYGTTFANDPATGLTGIMLTNSTRYYIASGNFTDFWTGAFAAIEG